MLDPMNALAARPAYERPTTQSVQSMPQFQNLSPQVQAMVQNYTPPTTSASGRPMRPTGPHFLTALQGGQGGMMGDGASDPRRVMTPEWLAYNEAMDAFRAARQAGPRGMEKQRAGGPNGQPAILAQPLPGQATQIAPAMPQGFAPPGMVGSSYAVRGMTPGATPFDLPTY